MRTRSLQHLALVTLLATLSAPASALVVNGEFDQNDDHWPLYDPMGPDSKRWLAVDAGGSTQSGAIELTNTGVGNGGTQRIVSQCIDISGVLGEQLTLSGRALIPGGGGQAAGWLLLSQAMDTGCVQAVAETPDLYLNGVFDQWDGNSLSFTPFDQTRSIRISLAIWKPAGEAADSIVLFDQIRLAGDRVFGDGFQP